MNNYVVHCLSEAVSPIRHASGTVGNEMVVAREPVVTSQGKRWVPFISGNALRHRCIREPGVMWLIDIWGLAGQLTKDHLNFLLHGGNLTESTAFENTRRIADFNRLFPLLKCLGGCLPNQILKGSMTVDRGVLACEENRPTLEKILPQGVSIDAGRLLSSEVMVGPWQHTRGDAVKTGLCPPTDDQSQSNLMIFSGQQVNVGSLFVHGFHLNHVTILELGAVLLSLRLWQSQGGTVGGHAARGAGRLSTSILCGEDQDQAVDLYVQHAVENRETCVAWLHDVFKPVADKPVKPKRGKEKAPQRDLLTEVGDS